MHFHLFSGISKYLYWIVLVLMMTMGGANANVHSGQISDKLEGRGGYQGAFYVSDGLVQSVSRRMSSKLGLSSEHQRSKGNNLMVVVSKAHVFRGSHRQFQDLSQADQGASFQQMAHQYEARSVSGDQDVFLVSSE